MEKKLTKKDMIDKILEFKEAKDLVMAAKELDIDISLETAEELIKAVHDPDFDENNIDDLDGLNGCGDSNSSSDSTWWQQTWS